MLHASSGSEALALLAGGPPAIDLLVTDIVMPRMSGLELAGQLLEQYPELPVLYLSGHSEKSPLRAPRRARVQGFLQKPFTRRALLDKVRDMLDRAGQGRGAAARNGRVRAAR